MLCQKFFVTSQQLILKISPDSARDGSFGGFYVKVRIIYYTDKQLVRYLLNIPMYITLHHTHSLLHIGIVEGTIYLGGEHDDLALHTLGVELVAIGIFSSLLCDSGREIKEGVFVVGSFVFSTHTLHII